MAYPAIDMTGQQVGRLTVIRRNGINATGALWLAECECGNTVTVAGRYLRDGRTRSCGCLRVEMGKINFRKNK